MTASRLLTESSVLTFFTWGKRRVPPLLLACRRHARAAGLVRPLPRVTHAEACVLLHTHPLSHTMLHNTLLQGAHHESYTHTK